MNVWSTSSATLSAALAVQARIALAIRTAIAIMMIWQIAWPVPQIVSLNPCKSRRRLQLILAGLPSTDEPSETRKRILSEMAAAIPPCLIDFSKLQTKGILDG